MSKMGVSQSGHLTSAGSAAYESLLYQERLVHFLYRAGVLAQSRSNGAESHGSSSEFIYYRGKYLIVHLVEAVAVYVEGLEREAGYLGVDVARCL